MEVINRLEEILSVALDYRVSDIHFCVFTQKEEIRIEMRMNNEMRQVTPKKEDIRVFRYLLYQANLDISNHFVPQTGHFSMHLGTHIIHLRFAVLANQQMLNGVLRILSTKQELSLEELCKEADVINFFRNFASQKEGLIVFSGPTGSGKTTSLYTILKTIQNKKIYSLEDPIEVEQEHFVQLQINEKQNFTYANGIKQLMRHDPDILMIGEIRDDIAASSAVRAALTGHLVFTSIHSQNAHTTIERLLDLGVNSSHLKECLFAIINQRLLVKGNQKKAVFEIADRKEISNYFETCSFSK